LHNDARKTAPSDLDSIVDTNQPHSNIMSVVVRYGTMRTGLRGGIRHINIIGYAVAPAKMRVATMRSMTVGREVDCKLNHKRIGATTRYHTHEPGQPERMRKLHFPRRYLRRLVIASGTSGSKSAETRKQPPRKQKKVISQLVSIAPTIVPETAIAAAVRITEIRFQKGYQRSTFVYCAEPVRRKNTIKNTLVRTHTGR
jgi:hypothetical protein